MAWPLILLLALLASAGTWFLSLAGGGWTVPLQLTLWATFAVVAATAWKRYREAP
jgi:membrane protein implicated in regulation of membrane protease activity